MKKLVCIILIIMVGITLVACAREVEMLPELRCHKCGGEYKYDRTITTFLNDTYYYYVCQTCGAELRTETWRGK